MRTDHPYPLLRIEMVHRLAALATLVLLIGLYFDGWWHGTFGRHSFWIPPHLVIYSGAGLAAGIVLLRWLADRQAGRALAPGYRLLGAAVALTALAAPFDELWHRTFGEEMATSVLSFWSPPHLTGLLSAIAGGLGVLSTMAREGGPQRFPWAMIVQLVGVIGFATFVMIPFEPTGIYRVGGVAGPFAIVVVLVGLRLLAVTLLRRPGTTTAIAAILTPLIVFLSRTPSPDTRLAPPILQTGILVAAAFGAAAVLDLLYFRRPERVEDRHTLGRWGMAYTAAFTLVFYPAANAVLASGWDGLEVVAIVAGSILSGFGAGWVAWWAAKRLVPA